MSKNLGEPIECPFCGEKTVLARVATTYYFVSDHPIYKDGVNMDGETMGQILGEMTCPPVMKYVSFRCDSCGKEWSVYDYAPVKGENGELSFVKQEKKSKKKGKKADYV